MQLMGGAIIDNTRKLQKPPMSLPSVSRMKPVRITPGMNRFELAKALGVSPEDLPPSEEIGGDYE